MFPVTPQNFEIRSMKELLKALIHEELNDPKIQSNSGVHSRQKSYLPIMSIIIINYNYSNPKNLPISLTAEEIMTLRAWKCCIYSASG